jgi:hypothetical protein
MNIDITAEEATALEIAVKQFDIDDPNDDFLLGMISLRKKIREAWLPGNAVSARFAAAVSELRPSQVPPVDNNGNTVNPIPAGMVGFEVKPVPDGSTIAAPETTAAA